MVKKRKTIPRRVEKLIFQEACSQCPFRSEKDVSSLHIHHIDSDPSNNNEMNLILVCASCHAKVGSGVISEADVVTKKLKLHWELKQQPEPGNSVNVSISGSNFRGDIAHRITKISSPKQPKIKHPPGSIGSNLEMKGYIDYLLARFDKFRSADTSYGRGGKYSYAVIHKNIQQKFGYKTFFALFYASRAF